MKIERRRGSDHWKKFSKIKLGSCGIYFKDTYFWMIFDHSLLRTSQYAIYHLCTLKSHLQISFLKILVICFVGRNKILQEINESIPIFYFIFHLNSTISESKAILLILIPNSWQKNKVFYEYNIGLRGCKNGFPSHLKFQIKNNGTWKSWEA